jgi:ribosome-binding factor A
LARRSRPATASLEGGQTQRQLRVGEELRHALDRICREAGFRDPELADADITITEVRISPDLKNATVFVLPFGGGDAAALAKALARAEPYLRREVAKLVQLRHAPNLRFAPDLSFDEADRINRALKDPTVERDLAAPSANDGAGEAPETPQAPHPKPKRG